MKFDNQMISRYVGAFATGAIGVLAATTGLGQPITATVIGAAATAGLIAAWKLSVTPPTKSTTAQVPTVATFPATQQEA